MHEKNIGYPLAFVGIAALAAFLSGAIAPGAGHAEVASTTLTGTVASSTSASSTPPAYCPSATSSEGYFVDTDLMNYASGQTVNFCLSDNTRTPLFYEGLHPWQVTDASGNVIYQPPAGTLAENPAAMSYFTDLWSGSDASGTPVAQGTYHIVFPGLPGSPFATLMIGSSGTSTSTTTPDLSTLIADLEDLQTLFPKYAVLIGNLITDLTNGSVGGAGSTTPGASGAFVDQNGGTFSVGGSVDFSGRNFGHEEDVVITRNGQQVARAHADGGGNFSTGSIPLSSTPGSYTYVFSQPSNALTMPVTITVK